MNSVTRMAMPVPTLGSALTEDGDAYVDSLSIQLSIDGKPLLTMTGTQFEWLMSSARIRHLAFHPRTRAFVPGEMKAPALTERIERYWSAIDDASSEAGHGLRENADTVATAARSAGMVSWSQVN